MPNKTHHNSMQSSTHSKDHRHHHRSTRSSGSLSHNGGTQYPNESTFHRRSVSPPSAMSMQYSAYFISRVDLEDYTEQTLKQTVDSVVSGSKIRGLKVKLIFPDDGLIVDNAVDSSQSWMYKASELLYFWRDPFYMNIIVAVTSNRLRPTATGPYSASIFRLRGDGLVQLFFQRAQHFFSQYVPGPASTSSNSKILVEKSTTVDSLPVPDHQKKSKHHSMTNKQSPTKSGRSLQTTPVRQGTRTEFDPGRTKTKARSSIFNLYNNRTNSESTLANDTRSKASKRRSANYEDDNKVTSISVHLSGEHVAELMRELKELRNEIASLKLEARFTPVRSTSTSPMTVGAENALNAGSLSTSLPALASQSASDGEKSNGVSLLSPRQPQNDFSATNKRKNDQANLTVNKRTSSTSSNNNESDKEDAVLVNFTEMSGSIDVASPSNGRDDNASATFPIRPRPIKTYPHSFPHLTSSTFNPLPNGNSSKSTANDDDATSFIIPIQRPPPASVKSGEIVSFRSALENTMDPPDHTYENLAPSSQSDTTKSVPEIRINGDNDPQSPRSDLYVNSTVDRDNDGQQLYPSQSSDPQRRVVVINAQESTQVNSPSTSSNSPAKDTTSSQTADPPANISARSQNALFANRLTNPVFSVDRQLLANTIANQFDLHLNSPYLQKLIENQHLFVSQKRTYANMIWQMTPEEETALRSSPVKPSPNVIDSSRLDPNSSMAKSILKQNKTRSMQRKQRISWDSRVE